ncbi:nibrin isoform X3 [Lagopus leucura]|uniref:nibrin isoform X3 n=1 Tax=Lagopus leucura TaxID=30410 RepID=UPI001C685C89|nr:nibrin isoform X3 [Lagopus leucura]
MWKLVPAAGPGEPFRLLVGTEYVVGRKNCAILIQDDQSISRSHAVLTVSQPETTHSQSVSVPVLTIKDTSKYGTSVNGSKLSGTSRTLQSGDRVNFGVFESKFRVEYESLVVCSSCLDVAQKTALNEAIQQLGGLVVNEWTKECTHLIMASVKVTVKTICALICGRPIVKPEFFNELMKAVQSRQQLPTPENFYPSVDEPSIGIDNMDLTGRPERKKIFSGKTFVFLTAKQHKKLGPAVVLGGGEAKLMTEGRKETSLLVSPEVCVVDVGMTNSQILGSESMRNWTDSILTVLESNNLRAIPEAEIGLAVIFMSTERYCNPQRQPDNKAVTANAASGAGPAISQSLAVDETIMPTAAADNSALYVADTEIEEQTWERAEEEETSVPKLAKLEKSPLLVSKCTESSASSTWDSEKEQHRKGNNIQLGRETSEIASDKTDTKITFSENPAPKKRKELGDVSEDLETLEMVFESRDLDWEEQAANGDQEAQSNKRKRRCLETKGSGTEEGNTKQRDENEMLRKDEVGSVLTLEEKSEIKEESSVSVRNKFINHNKLEDDSSHLPSKLLLTEFRSLVVSCPRPNSPTIRNTKCRGQNNFKTFRKVPYPGAGQLPYIIGGSDLVAHQTRKNSELEEWLREELEEQNRRAREESLADDLFRYDPNVKRRR